MRPVPIRHAGFLLAMLVFACAFYKMAHRQVGPGFQMQDEPLRAIPVEPPRGNFASSRDNVSTHASSLIELPNGNVRAFWFSGSREGAADVEIHTSVWDAQSGRWGDEHAVATREWTEQGLHRYVSKLGNPVPFRAEDGSLQLFYVTVSLGGWAGSSITRIVSHDQGETWAAPQRLVTSPFLNISTLVKGAPFTYRDGTIGLPVYHEFIGKFAELLRLDAQGCVLDKQRLADGASRTLQPVVLVRGGQEAEVLMRNASGESPRRVKRVSTRDGGAHWSTPEPTEVSNPDAALSAVVLRDGRLLAALNDVEEGRDTLALAISADAQHWKVVYRVEDQRGQRQLPEGMRTKHIDEMLRAADERFAAAQPEVRGQAAEQVQRQACVADHCGFEFSYPYLVRTARGDIHLSYTWNRRYIRHVRLSESWLAQQIGQVAHD